MTGRQRKVHVVMWAVLGPVALAGLAIALVLKPAEPVQDGVLPGADVGAGVDAGAGDSAERHDAEAVAP